MDKENQKPQTRVERHGKMSPKNQKKMDRVLNYLIVLVSILIVITGFIIFTGSKDSEPNKSAQNAIKEDATEEQGNVEEKKEEPTEDQQEDNQQAEDSSTEEKEEESAVTETTSSDPLVDKVVVDANWQPTATKQTGEHISSYDVNSVDWQEKIATILQTVGLTEDQTIIWSVRNNGSAQTAIGVVSSKDKAQKYRVSIEWVDQQGWKPVKKEVLNSLDGAY